MAGEQQGIAFLWVREISAQGYGTIFQTSSLSNTRFTGSKAVLQGAPAGRVGAGEIGCLEPLMTGFSQMLLGSPSNSVTLKDLWEGCCSPEDAILHMNLSQYFHQDLGFNLEKVLSRKSGF